MRMWGDYVPMSVRRTQANKEMDKLQKKGFKVEPVVLDGRRIANKFWGKKWCDHLESFADYYSRLERGRRYIRNGSVCHLNIQNGKCEAFVSGSSLYKVSVTIKALAKDKWERIKQRCSGKVGSLLELLQGKISDQVMEIVSDHEEGLFPASKEISFNCSCPDWAGMCKHIAAVLYSVGSRLDNEPDKLFLLRGVDGSELVTAKLTLETAAAVPQLESSELEAIFDIDFDAKMETKLPQKIQKEQKGQSSQKNTAKSKKINLGKLTGKKVKAYREQMGFTIPQFAKEINMTPAAVSRWENTEGPLNLRDRSKTALAEFLRRNLGILAEK